MAFKNLREYIAALEEHGELKRVKKEVDWNLEAGAITRLVCEKGLPSPLFEKVKGYPGYRILGAPISTFRKLAIAMGLSPETSIKELIDIYLQRKNKLTKPVIVDKSQAPCKENIDIGDQVDLLKFPAPMLHDGDGGRYLCTWQINVTKDPDTGRVNWGCYRGMVATKNTITGSVSPAKDIGTHFQKYRAKKTAMPFAIAIGPEPVSGFIAGARVAATIYEAELAGALRQEPVELVKCETVDLEVPATAEIVIEGEISLTETDWEGPFGEFVGYSATGRGRSPVWKVKAVTYRNNPILTISNTGVPVDEYHLDVGLVRSAELYDKLRSEGVPAAAVNAPPEGVGFLVIVSVSGRAPNIAERVASCIWGSAQGTHAPFVMVVNDDVDVFDIWQVIHAMVTRCHPYRNIWKVERASAIPFMTFLNAYERQQRLGAKVCFDCTWPADWDATVDIPPKISFNNNYSKEVRDHVLKNWEKYGFDKLA
jgi:4-hydroxy-3-polyprenylbenzoate decarboxylase